jgi:hypothetical protein
MTAERAAGEAAEGEAMMHEARKGDFLTQAWPSTVRTPRLDEKEFLAGVLRPFHDAIVKALAPHFDDVFEGEDHLLYSLSDIFGRVHRESPSVFGPRRMRRRSFRNKPQQGLLLRNLRNLQNYFFEAAKAVRASACGRGSPSPR